MAVYNIHAGHSLICRGASALLDEVTEDRIVKNKVIEYLRAMGHTVYDCTDDNGKTQNANLSNIVKKCNAHAVDLDVSIHLNSGRNDPSGDNSTGGTEVYGYDNKTANIGSAICNEIASALGIRNRGFKTNSGYYILRKTKSSAIIIECCFVDDKDDANHWDPDKCARAIVKGITGQNPSTGTSTPTPPTSNKYSVGIGVKFGTSYPTPTSPCGINYATGGSGQGVITAIVAGQAKYQIDHGTRYCNDGDIYATYTPVTGTPSKKTLTVNATYMVYANGKWYPAVKNLEDYAGDGANGIKAIAIKVDAGSVKYRAHIKNGGWQPYVTGYNPSDFDNGYAGDGANEIDAVEVYFNTPEGYRYKKAKYRVAPVYGKYYGWQTDNDTDNKMDGYAGKFGKSIGKFQLTIE